jgi:hypothetical protein
MELLPLISWCLSPASLKSHQCDQMIFPAAGLDGLTSLDVQQLSPLIDHLLKMPQESLSSPAINKNMPLLPVPRMVPQHIAGIAGIAGQLHGPGCTRDVAPGPVVLLALGYR